MKRFGRLHERPYSRPLPKDFRKAIDDSAYEATVFHNVIENKVLDGVKKYDFITYKSFIIVNIRGWECCAYKNCRSLLTRKTSGTRFTDLRSYAEISY